MLKKSVIQIIRKCDDGFWGRTDQREEFSGRTGFKVTVGQDHPKLVVTIKARYDEFGVVLTHG